MGIRSSHPETGVTLNPRVAFADKVARKEGKVQLIDAPVLVKLQNGTVRYRYDGSKPSNTGKKHSETAHEGNESLANKKGYFYHVRLNDYSENAAYEKEEAWKFYYVVKGPQSAKQKKLFYVFGKGMNIENDNKINSHDLVAPRGHYHWPDVVQVQGHVYYDLYFLAQSEELEIDEDNDISPENESDSKTLELTINREDDVNKLRERISMRTLKPPLHIHVFHQGRQMIETDIIGDFRDAAIKQWKNFKVILKPK